MPSIACERVQYGIAECACDNEYLLNTVLNLLLVCEKIEVGIARLREGVFSFDVSMGGVLLKDAVFFYVHQVKIVFHPMNGSAWCNSWQLINERLNSCCRRGVVWGE